MHCRRIESLLPPYVDGEARASEVAEIERHLAECAGCRAAVEAQRTVRIVLQARGQAIAPHLPPGFRSRITATLGASPRPSLGWGGRLTAFAAAAVILLVAVSALELVAPQSSVLYAAQLAIDHVRCFVVEKAATAKADPAVLRQFYAEHYGWDVRVPASNDAIGLQLVAARRCPYWVGRHAHLLYRTGDHEVSLYMDQGDSRPEQQLQILGHAEHIWQSGGSSYTVIARGVPEAQLTQITAYLQSQTR